MSGEYKPPRSSTASQSIMASDVPQGTKSSWTKLEVPCPMPMHVHVNDFICMYAPCATTLKNSEFFRLFLCIAEFRMKFPG